MSNHTEQWIESKRKLDRLMRLRNQMFEQGDRSGPIYEKIITDISRCRVELAEQMYSMKSLLEGYRHDK